jgi:predicted SpoU family rRNA methylase
MIYKIVRSDRGKYYMKHAHYGRVLRPFVRFLEKSGIVAHYSMHGDTLQNKMSERHKHTLIYIYSKRHDKLLHFVD